MSSALQKRHGRSLKMTQSKQQGHGKGPTNLSGARGASPVLRVRVPPALMERAEAMAAAAGVSVADWVRGLIERARK